MLEVIPQVIASRYGVTLRGTPHIYRDGRSVKVVWVEEDVQFTFYSNGNWDLEREDGEFIEGHTDAPTRKVWVGRLEKLYWPEYATAAWWEWVALRGKRR